MRIHNGVAQGEALYTIADVAIVLEILRDLRSDEKVFTLEMKINFIKKGLGNKLFLHRGNTTVVAQCRNGDEKEAIVAHAFGTFYNAHEKFNEVGKNRIW